MKVYLIYETDDTGAVGNMGYIPSHPLYLGDIPAQSDHELLAWVKQMKRWENLPQDIQDRGDAVPLVKFVRGMFLDEDFDNRTELTSEQRIRPVKKEEWEFMQEKIDDAAVIHITTKDDLWEPHGLKQGDKVQLILANGKIEKEVVSVPDENSFEVGAVAQEPSQVFVYGKQVDDFLAVDYDRIYSTGISAIQELARRSEQNASKVETLEKEVADLKKMVAQLAEANKSARVAAEPAAQTHVTTVTQDTFATVSLDH